MSFLPAEQYLAQPRETEAWLIQNLLPSTGFANLYGQAKSGKSFAALGMAMAISNPAITSWLNFPVMKHGPVAYLQVDTPRERWCEYLVGIKQAGHDLSNIWFADDLMTPEFPSNILHTATFKWLLEEIARIKPAAVIVDTLRDMHDQDENDATVMKNVVTNIKAACRPAIVLLLSHARKATQATQMAADDVMGDNRGSSYVVGKMDMVMRLTRRSLLWQGRAAGSGSIQICQQAPSGLLMLDGESAKQRALLIETIHSMRALTPSGLTQKAIAEAYAVALEEAKLKEVAHSTACKQIKALYEELRLV